MFFLRLFGPHAFHLHPVFPCCCAFSACPQLFPFLSPFLFASRSVGLLTASCLPSCLPFPSSPLCCVRVSQLASTCLLLVSLFALLSHFVSTFSGLVWLSLTSVFHLSSASLFVSFVCPLARNLLKPGFQLETTEFKFPGGPFKNLPGFGPSSSEEPCFTISIQTTEVRVSLRSGSCFFLHGTVPAQSPALPVLLVVAGIMRL